MKFRSYLLAVAALALLALAVSALNGGVAHAFQVIPGHPASTIGSATVTLTQDQIDPNSPNTMGAFVPTGSASRQCLVTLGDTNVGFPGLLLLCRHRVVNGVDGVFISVFNSFELPSDAVVILTVYQERAQFYGSPVQYTGP